VILNNIFGDGDVSFRLIVTIDSSAVSHLESIEHLNARSH